MASQHSLIWRNKTVVRRRDDLLRNLFQVAVVLPLKELTLYDTAEFNTENSQILCLLLGMLHIGGMKLVEALHYMP
jgi:hypothetical protein